MEHAHNPHPTRPSEPPTLLLPLPACAGRRRRPGPAAAARSALWADPGHRRLSQRAHRAAEEDQNTNKEVDRPAPFRDDLRRARDGSMPKPCLASAAVTTDPPRWGRSQSIVSNPSCVPELRRRDPHRQPRPEEPAGPDRAHDRDGGGLRCGYRRIGNPLPDDRDPARAPLRPRNQVEELIAAPRAGRPSVLDDYQPYLHERWNAGVTNACWVPKPGYGG
jgi:hypothetical protein